MSTNRLFDFLIVTVVAGGILLAGCSPQPAPVASTPAEPQAGPTIAAAPTEAPTPAKPITLRLVVYDNQGSPSEPYVLEFIDQVKTLSGGSIVVEPTWNAGAQSSPGTEPDVIKAVLAAKYDLGLVASRAWDTEKVTSFQALQAPFLINNDALAIAVATSDIAKQMLDSLSPAGAVGLAGVVGAAEVVVGAGGVVGAVVGLGVGKVGSTGPAQGEATGLPSMLELQPETGIALTSTGESSSDPPARPHRALCDNRTRDSRESQISGHRLRRR